MMESAETLVNKGLQANCRLSGSLMITLQQMVMPALHFA
jgi:hypothetical protein